MSVAAELSHFTAACDAQGWVEFHHGEHLVERHHVSRWLRDADPVDQRMLRRCAGPTIDIGCGPGRLTAALTARGVPALGVDVSAQAVAHSRERGAAVLCRDVFHPLPAQGRWRWALLCDGNIGIGGDPVRLLSRVAELVCPLGGAIVEVCPEEVDHRGSSRLRQVDGSLGPAFAWAVLGARALCDAATASGWWVEEDWRDGGRRFVALRLAAVRTGDAVRA